MITIFTPSFADEDNTNAQNLTVKEVVSRLPPDRFRVIMLGEGAPDPRILARENTEILPFRPHGNTGRWLARLLLSRMDVYFFPREGPLDSLYLSCRRALGLRTALVTYVVTAVDEVDVGPIQVRSIREGDYVAGNSLFVTRTVTDRFGVPAGTVYDGVRRDVFFPPPAGRDGRAEGPRLTVLFAGSFPARKRPNVVISEAAKHPLVAFRLAGKGKSEEEESVRSLVEQSGCSNVTFVGHLSQHELAEEMRKADIFLFPSVIEGHPQVLVQAAACGLPAIAMEKYRPDFVVNGETGYLVKSESELSEKLSLLLGDRELRLRMSVAAARHALQFDWDDIARDWQKIFVEVAAKRRK